jgi:hypothetical protein
MREPHFAMREPPTDWREPSGRAQTFGISPKQTSLLKVRLTGKDIECRGVARGASDGVIGVA